MIFFQVNIDLCYFCTRLLCHSKVYRMLSGHSTCYESDQFVLHSRLVFKWSILGELSPKSQYAMQRHGFLCFVPETLVQALMNCMMQYLCVCICIPTVC